MSPPLATVALARPPLEWGRSVAWLLFLAPFFFLSYGYSNQLAAENGVTESFYFAWEKHIPFVPWTILPYWSIDLLYGFSFLACRGKQAVDRHALRLLTAQLISVACFIAAPLNFAFDRPQVGGFFGTLFDMLMGFDQPYNQAPSLHIGLLVIVWARFIAGLPRPWHVLVHAWGALIGVSVLTTYQHHFIDVPTGALVGFICLWVWPDTSRSPLSLTLHRMTSVHRRLALRYFLGAIATAWIALAAGGMALLLCWGAVALALVGTIYLGADGSNFQKEHGRHPFALSVLLAPYQLGAWINSRLWTRRHPAPDCIVDDIWLGRLPNAEEMRTGVPGGFAALFDLCAELPAPHGQWRYACRPWLDLVPPTAVQLREAAVAIENLRGNGPLLVCCALGYSRSACAVLAWMLVTNRAGSVGDAMRMVHAKRPHIVLSAQHRAALEEMVGQHRVTDGEDENAGLPTT